MHADNEIRETIDAINTALQFLQDRARELSERLLTEEYVSQHEGQCGDFDTVEEVGALTKPSRPTGLPEA